MKKLKKNIQAGKISFLIILSYFFMIGNSSSILASEKLEGVEGKFIEIRILDKVSSKSNLVKLKIGEKKNLKIY